MIFKTERQLRFLRGLWNGC